MDAQGTLSNGGAIHRCDDAGKFDGYPQAQKLRLSCSHASMEMLKHRHGNINDSKQPHQQWLAEVLATGSSSDTLCCTWCSRTCRTYDTHLQLPRGRRVPTLPRTCLPPALHQTSPGAPMRGYRLVVVWVGPQGVWVPGIMCRLLVSAFLQKHLRGGMGCSVYSGQS